MKGKLFGDPTRNEELLDRSYTKHTKNLGTIDYGYDYYKTLHLDINATKEEIEHRYELLGRSGSQNCGGPQQMTRTRYCAQPSQRNWQK